MAAVGSLPTPDARRDSRREAAADLPLPAQRPPSGPPPSGAASAANAGGEADGIRLVERPADPQPQLVEDERALVRAASVLAEADGPVAIDAERASGYRYGQRAYLVQVRRGESGTWLVDPVACPDLGPIADAVDGVEWIVHAATQDLPCLAELGLRPTRLFDTELGSRLAGLPRVGLSAVLEHYLGVRLAKEHSAVDWSTRPLPEPWLAYAALDVELLHQLREALAADLAAQGKWEWAQQEFEHLLGYTGPAPRTDPWRRTSGIHRARGRRTLAVVRHLWWARDDLARRRDVSPGRILPDAALLDIARAAPGTADELGAASRHKGVRRNERLWLQAVREALDLPEKELPPASLPSDAPPPTRSWADREPVAAARFAAVRDELLAASAEFATPVENLLSPDALRRILWRPPAPEGVADDLARRGARPWQIALTAPLIVAAMHDHPDQPAVADAPGQPGRPAGRSES